MDLPCPIQVDPDTLKGEIKAMSSDLNTAINQFVKSYLKTYLDKNELLGSFNII